RAGGCVADGVPAGGGPSPVRRRGADASGPPSGSSGAGSARGSANTTPWREERTMTHHRIVSQDEWLATRRELLTKEKELTRLRDEVSRQRRELPWVRVEKPYVFDTPRGKQTFGRLFGRPT